MRDLMEGFPDELGEITSYEGNSDEVDASRQKASWKDVENKRVENFKYSGVRQCDLLNILK